MAGAVGGFSRGRLFHYTESKPWRRAAMRAACCSQLSGHVTCERC